MKSLKKRIRKYLIPKNKLLVFTFHQAGPEFDPKFNNKFIWSPIEFLEQQLHYLNENFPIVSLSDGLFQLRNGQLKGTSVAITFDDGDISIKKFVAPLLQKLNIPATFFINTAYLTEYKKGYWFNIYNYLKFGDRVIQDKIPPDLVVVAENLRNTNDVDFYRRHFPIIEKLSDFIAEGDSFYMSLDDINNLDSSLFNIGLHGHEHQRFSMMPREWQHSNLVKNIEILSKIPAYKPIFAVPFGKEHDWNNDTVQLCKEFNLEIAFSNGGFNTAKSFGIQRIPADGLKIPDVISKLSSSKFFK
jgi:peptidoglycan/xylan/chitin deacetylase (PgdA/CDA1 family)